MFLAIGSLIGKIVTSFSSGYQAKKETEQEQIKAASETAIAKIENKTKIVKAKGELALAKINAKAKKLEREDNHTQDYDMQVLKNRNNTFADEVIIIVWFAVFLFHFFPLTQPYMEKGWDAMGYSDGPAWWFEFGMVGILVSTLGLMRVLKLLIGGFKSRFGNANKVADTKGG